jgi:hypothetical protein
MFNPNWTEPYLWTSNIGTIHRTPKHNTQ